MTNPHGPGVRMLGNLVPGLGNKLDMGPGLFARDLSFRIMDNKLSCEREFLSCASFKFECDG
jgi:hypothetical protein